MRFSYKAYENGKYATGQVEAPTVKDVAEYLRKNNLIPVSIEPNNSLVHKLLPQVFDKVSQGEIVDFTRQFAIMLNAGLTISGALDILIQQTPKDSLRDMYNAISSSIKSGDSFSKALGKQPQLFSRLYLSLIKAGEASGKLNEIMAKMADDLEKQREYAAKIKGTMMYPIIILVGVVGVLAVLLTFVVPQLSGLYKDMGVELPLQTKVLIGASDFLVHFWPLVVLIIAAIAYGIKTYFSKEAHKFTFDSFLLKIPKFGEILVNSTLVSTTRTLSLLIQSGVLVLESINIIINSTGNLVFQQSFRNIYRSVQNGATLSESFAKEEIFPPILVQMVAVGERTGKLDEVLRKISQFFEMQSDIAVKAMTTLLEPLMLVILGGIVFMVVMAVITPIYTLTSSLGG